MQSHTDKHMDNIMSNEVKLSIQAALSKAMLSCGYTRRDGEVSFGKTNYRYASHAAIIASIRHAMVEEGITMRCVKIDVIEKDKSSILGRFTFRFENESGFLDVEALGQGMDSGDKAVYKAMTGAQKYALRQTFVIETGDDPDSKASEQIKDEIARKEIEAFKITEPDPEHFKVIITDMINKSSSKDSLNNIIKSNQVELVRMRSSNPDIASAIEAALKEKRAQL